MDFDQWLGDALDYFSKDIEAIRPREEGEFTAKEFRNWLKEKGVEVSVKVARDSWLAKAVEEGRAIRRPYLELGHPTYLYKWVKK